ncbi:GNAT family N-acetyltransferase [Motilimonas cestriensis]|uniref:GNAT family N-acetyltransferase n=1 Tax=Motilimonas cestriensis TaxID=2742685 RepID=A0ABS8W9A3_9GAMM|nr:GNAT family protein [Motilimonas cestriensis]MCE2595591.1 GNAT family N-acetyltransferase [Motilimonas cestriensis]
MKQAISAYKMVLRDIAADDIETLRQWRNQHDIRSQMLDQQLITVQQQQVWFKGLAQQKSQQHFALEYKGQLVGYANIKSPTKMPLQQAGQILETGLYLGAAKYRGTFLAFCVALALTDYCFDELKAKQLIATVLPSNQAALNFNQQLGYVIDNQDNEQVSMTLALADYEASKAKLTRFIR